MNILLAVVIGGLFGFVLDRIGATNPSKIINMMRLTDISLLRIIFGAVGISSILLFAGLDMGIVDVGHLSVKSSYVGVIVGGAILGIGFAISGFCPGTGLTAFATGRKDAGFFILGGIVGAGIFMMIYEFIKDTVLFDKIMGGSVTLFAIEGSKYEGLSNMVSATTGGIILGTVFVVIALVLPNKIR